MDPNLSQQMETGQEHKATDAQINNLFKHASLSQDRIAARDDIENWYTGALATEINRGYGGSRGLSTHAVSNSLALR